MSVHATASDVKPRRGGGDWRRALSHAAARIALFAAALGIFVVANGVEQRAARRPLSVATTGGFAPDGHYPGAGSFAAAPAVPKWGSWVDADTHRGALTLGPFVARRRLLFGVSGYPNNEGNGIFLERVGNGERMRVPVENAAESWQWVEFIVPRTWRGETVRLVAIDDAIGYGGWLGLTEPLRGWGSGAAFRSEVRREWAAWLLLFAVVALLLGRWLARHEQWHAFAGGAGSLGVFLLLVAPWVAHQHALEPNFTTLLAGTLGLAALAMLVVGQLTGTPRPLRERSRELGAALRAWWREPALNAWVVGALALLLFLHKPHSLHTPQLYAEDGSIFLVFTDLLGARAMLEPYMGYLHFVPMFTAWSAARLLDVAWWPAFYNGVAFALWVAVIARMFSRRNPLPGKPWLALACFLGPQTGEILFNITNAQWILALVLIQQVVFHPPATRGQRVSDLLLLGIVGLTGPFSIAFAPLFAWRWWRNRNPDTLAALLVVAAGAAVQGWTILHASKPFHYQANPFQVWPTLEVLARRLVVWPVAGTPAALALPGGLTSALGIIVLGALLAITFRPHPEREVRARLAAAFLLILAVGVYRIRPDSWTGDNLIYGDRYFYLPRVLIAWLLILQFHARSKTVAWTARALCLAMAVAHLPGYVIPAPPDYHWKENCDPIRRGDPGYINTLPEGWYIEYGGRAKP